MPISHTSNPRFRASSVGHIVAAVLLLTMAWLQLNDPDPWYWIAVYFISASVPIRQLCNRPSAATLWIATGMILSGLLIAAPGFIDYLNSGNFGAITGEMMDNTPYVESAREFGGLLIAAGILACYRSQANV